MFPKFLSFFSWTFLADLHLVMTPVTPDLARLDLDPVTSPCVAVATVRGRSAGTTVAAYLSPLSQPGGRLMYRF